MAEASTLPAYRLPSDIVPIHYDLSIITSLGPEEFSFQGVVKIKVECFKTTNTIKVHARDLIFSTDEIKVAVASGDMTNKPILVEETYTDSENEFFVVIIKEPFTPGMFYTISLTFQGQLKEDLIGYYRSKYLDHGCNSTKWLAVTHFEPNDARQAFPCFDEPALKATFAIKLAHKKSFKSVSNMPLKSTSPFPGREDWVWSEFETTVPMSSYLIAYMVSEFESRQPELQPGSHVQFRVWARRDAIGQTQFASQVGPNFLSFYEDFFCVKYPLPKQDLLAIPDFKIGAMENWGIITFRESLLLMDEKQTSTSSKLFIASTIAHELAHMWFGNLVTMHWWTDLWLKEGFATYMASLAVHHEFPEWNSLDESAMSDLLNVFSLDSLKSSHPVSVPINHPREISQIFDAISYDKGSFLLRMMSLFLGEEVFRAGVSQYLNKHQYKNAEQDDLWASFTEQAHRYHALPSDLTVKQIMDTWTLQTGYPLITVTRDYANHNAVISQKRFLAVKSDNDSDYKGRWWVPISFSTPKQSQFEQTQPNNWLSNEKESMELHVPAERDQWIILNNRAAGLYRVNYDNRNWMLLISVLKSSDFSKIDVLNRAQLVIDSMDLAKLGDLSYELSIRLISYLRQEKAFIPWKAGLAKLDPIKKVLSRTANYGIFKKFMRWLMEPIGIAVVDLTKEPATLEGGRLLSTIADLACFLGVAGADVHALQLFTEWRDTPHPEVDNPIPKDVRRAVYSHAVREGGEHVWEFMWQRYKNANVSTEQENILVALTCTKEVWLLNRYLEWSLDENSGIRKQDAFIIFTVIARKDIGFYVAQKFFFSNIKRISDYFGAKSSIIGKYFSSLANQMIYENELTELKWFAESNKELLEPASQSVSQALESVQINIRWMQLHYSTISSVLLKITNEA